MGIYPGSGRALGGGGGRRQEKLSPFLCLANIRAPLFGCALSSAFPQPVRHQSPAFLASPVVFWVLFFF